ncbi:hypothetical protein GCM10010528_04610 [Gordonia defluvii]|jgi:hypothetical protein|uniref:Secreted protein n=1 Tax=Gordonia defluvii TaxID=283718 RepID=A0ABN3YEP4_9ACTN|nr:hypothetical protein [Gordonia sp. UBA5067]
MHARVALVGLALVGTTGLVSPPPAQALVGRSVGQAGGVSVPEPARCKHDTGGNVTASSGPVTVTAPGRTAANVRIRTQNVTNGQLVAQSAWSRFQRVSPGSPTVFGGGTATGNWRSNVSLGYGVEFHRLGGGVMGSRFVQVTRYNFFNPYNVGPTGPISICRGH